MEFLQANLGWVSTLLGLLVGLGTWLWKTAQQVTTMQNQMTTMTANAAKMEGQLDKFAALLASFREESNTKLEVFREESRKRFEQMGEILTEMRTTIRIWDKEKP